MADRGWMVTRNSDLTEGRGGQVIDCVCRLEATARRRAQGIDVQGADGVVREVEVLVVGRHYYGPVDLVEPTPEDKAQQALIDARRAAEQKARNLGMTQDEIAALRWPR